MSTGLDNLKHIVVVMMSGRSFDHMLGGLKVVNPRINGLTGNETNPDAAGILIAVQPTAKFQGQFQRAPDTHFLGVDLQIFGGAPAGPGRVANMQGFVNSYAAQARSANSSRAVMSYFRPENLPVLTMLAQEYAVFNGWFSSVPGPTTCNRAFAHYGTSFGSVEMSPLQTQATIPSIYERMVKAGHTAKCYYYDEQSSLETTSLLKNQPQIFASYSNFIADCRSSTLPEYSFVDPCHNDHAGPGGGQILASDQHIDHNVQEGERFIASTYNAIRSNSQLWESTAILIVYDQHGGIFDHAAPPACHPDGYIAPPKRTGTGEPFNFDRLGVRVPAILVSPWIPGGTVVDSRIFEHASIPATVTKLFLGQYDKTTNREKSANTFLDILTDRLRPDDDCPFFDITGVSLADSVSTHRTGSFVVQIPRPHSPRLPNRGKTKGQKQTQPRKQKKEISVAAVLEDAKKKQDAQTDSRQGPSAYVARDRWTTRDSLGHLPYAYAIYRFLTHDETQPPLAISIQAPWGGGKTSLMRMIQAELDPDAVKRAEQPTSSDSHNGGRAKVKDVMQELEGKKEPHQAEPERTGTDLKSGTAGRTPIEVPPIAGGRERRVTVWFNAWKYESSSQVWAGLADCIVRQIGQRLGPVEREIFWFRLQLRRLDATAVRRKVYEEVLSSFLGKLLPKLWAYAAGPGLSLLIALSGRLWNSGLWQSIGWAGAIGSTCAELYFIWKQMSTAQSEVQEKPAGITLGELVAAPDYKANLGFVHEVVEDLKRVFELIPKEHLPVVIFIDDLDRCSPGKVAAVVEAINLFLAGEFPDCMFVLGIDDEMVAAALDEAHCNVIARLPGYARATSIGWRFMDKFVQLPFIVPPSSEEELSRYMDSLLSERQDSKSIDMELHDRAARIVEQNGATEQSSLSGEQQEALKQHIEITREMDQNIREFTDQEQSIRELISAHAKKHFANPRDLKRFVNLFRFYYFLRAARAARREMIPSLDQMSRWIALSLKWPEVVRWLRQQGATQDDSTNLALRTLERLGSVTHQTLEGWQKGARDQLGLQVDQTPWLSDEGLMRFFQNEASLAPEQQPLSACGRMGLW